VSQLDKIKAGNIMYFIVIVGLFVVICSLALVNYNYRMLGSLVMIVGLAIMNYGYKKSKNEKI
jgi:uncharacterized membrane protein